MDQTRPRITGKDYSVYNPTKARLGMRLWAEALIKAIPRHTRDESEPAAKEE